MANLAPGRTLVLVLAFAACGPGGGVPDHCTSGTRDSDEADVDCGGSCAPCGAGKRCVNGVDCASGLCTNNRCEAPSCSDGAKNGGETGVDCGGECPACGGADGGSDGSVADLSSPDLALVKLTLAFGAPVKLPLTPCVGVGTADFNRDGHADLVAAIDNSMQSKGNLSYLQNRGDGTFQPAAPIGGISNGVGWLTIGDLAGGMKPSVVVFTGPNPYGYFAIPGNGDGTFKTATMAVNTGTSYGGLLADLSGDGRAELVWTDGGQNVVHVALGNGDGTFAPADAPYVGTPTKGFAVGDLTGDGKPDLVAANGQGVLYVLLNNGQWNGAAGLSAPLASSSIGNVRQLADVNGDGKLDAVGFGDMSVGVMLGMGNGVFKAPASAATNAGIFDLVTADFDRDGALDVAALQMNGQVAIFRGKGDGTLFAPDAFPLPAGFLVIADQLVAADFDGDGKPDLAAAAGDGLYLLSNTSK